MRAVDIASRPHVSLDAILALRVRINAYTLPASVAIAATQAIRDVTSSTDPTRRTAASLAAEIADTAT